VSVCVQRSKRPGRNNLSCCNFLFLRGFNKDHLWWNCVSCVFVLNFVYKSFGAEKQSFCVCRSGV
jgi:hypothetical protein